MDGNFLFVNDQFYIYQSQLTKWLLFFNFFRFSYFETFDFEVWFQKQKARFNVCIRRPREQFVRTVHLQLRVAIFCSFLCQLNECVITWRHINWFRYRYKHNHRSSACSCLRTTKPQLLTNPLPSPLLVGEKMQRASSINNWSQSRWVSAARFFVQSKRSGCISFKIRWTSYYRNRSRTFWVVCSLISW